MECDFENDETITLKTLKRLILEEINLLKESKNDQLLDIGVELDKFTSK